MLLAFVLASSIHFGSYTVGGCKPPDVLLESPYGKFACVDKEACVVNQDHGAYSYTAGMPRNHFACEKSRGEKKNPSDLWPNGE